MTNLGLSSDSVPDDAFEKLQTNITSLNSKTANMCKYYTTSYTGNSQKTLTLNGIPFTPVYFAVIRINGDLSNNADNLFCVGNLNGPYMSVSMSYGSITITYNSAGTTINENAKQYRYFALGY